MSLLKDHGVWLAYEMRRLCFDVIIRADGRGRVKVWKGYRKAIGGRKKAQVVLSPLRVLQGSLKDILPTLVYDVRHRYDRGKWHGWRIGAAELAAAAAERCGEKNLDVLRNHIGRLMKHLPGWKRIQVIEPGGSRAWIYFQRD